MFDFKNNIKEKVKISLEKIRKKNESIKKRIADVATVATTAITAATVLVSFGSFENVKLNKSNQTSNIELLKALTYEIVNDGDDVVDGTDNVKFSAYFLCDTNDDGVDEKVKGTCKEVGAQDTLYIDLSVINGGKLKEGHIYFADNNFDMATSLPKDKVLKTNVIGTEIKEIELENIETGTTKTITGQIRSGLYANESGKNSALENNINNYSRNDNSVTLDAIYEDINGNERRITKSINLTVDWYGSLNTRIDNTFQIRNSQDIIKDYNEQTATMVFDILTVETQNQLLLKNNTVDATIPLMNGYEPTNVAVTSSNVDVDYNDETRVLHLSRSAITNEQGDVISSISSSNNYKVNVTYPIEAYQSNGNREFEMQIPVHEYYLGYNNNGTDFENPCISNIEDGTVRVIYDHITSQEDRSEAIVGTFRVNPYSDYVVSKLKPMRIYNGSSNYEKDDNYEVKWAYYRGINSENSSVILEETIEDDYTYSDDFINIDDELFSMEEYTNNIGIYFNNLENIMPEDGVINVYDKELGNLLLTIDKSNFNTYTKENPYYYNIPISHIYVEISGINPDRTIEVTSIKQINDELLTSMYGSSEFLYMQQIQTYLRTVKGENQNDITGRALYELPKSPVELSLSKESIETGSVNENFEFNIHAGYEQKNKDIGWVNGSFAISLPDEIVETNIKSVEIDNPNVSLKTYEYVENSNGKFIRVYTTNDSQEAYNISIIADITPNPETRSIYTGIDLYAFNEVGVAYYNETEDIYDINNDGIIGQRVGYSDVGINIYTPNVLLVHQTLSEFNEQGDVVVSPQVGDVLVGREGEAEKTAKIGIKIYDNHTEIVKDILILGKIPFIGNKEISTGQDLGSSFDSKMKAPGITVPSGLNATVYYSENENPSRFKDELSNGWVTAENVRDWSNIRTYLIELEDESLIIGDNYQFSYDISIPNGLDYNEYSYATFTAYYALVTDEGLYRTQKTSTKIGLHVSENYNLIINKFQENSPKYIPEAIYSVSEVKNVNGTEILSDSMVSYTNYLGEATFNNLYVETVYEIKEITAPTDYELNDNVIRIIGHINNSGELEVEKLSGITRGNIEISSSGNGKDAVIAVEDKPKARLIITKKDRETDNSVYGAKFQVTGKGIDKAFKTNAYGQIYVSGLSIGEEYTLTETNASGYYLIEPITIKIVENMGGYSIQRVGVQDNTISSMSMTEINSIPTGNITIIDDKIPTYNIEVNKVIEGTTEPLPGAKFRLYKGYEVIDDFESDAEGKIYLYDLHLFEEDRNIEQTYVLSEIGTPAGFTKAQDITFKAQKDANVLRLIEEDTQHYYTVDNDTDTISLRIEDSPLLRIVKQDAETLERLPGAKFAIYDLRSGEPAKDSKDAFLGRSETIDGTNYYVLTTNSYGEIIPDLPEGAYKLVELQASSEKYDISDATYYFSVGGIEVGNYPYIDYDEDLILGNHRSELLITTDVIEIDGNKGGTITGEDLEYYEKVRYGDNSVNPIVMTPDTGYEIIDVKVNGEEWDFEPLADGSYVIDSFENVKNNIHIEVMFCLSSNKFTINKVDDMTFVPLSGATFTIDRIIDENNPIELFNPYHVELTTNSKGKAIYQLPFGRYSVVETVSPTGYKLDQTPKIIDFREGENHEYTIEDEETAKVIVHHYLKGTEEKVAEDELIEGNSGEEYFTNPKLDIPEYELEQDEETGAYILPDNSTGLFERTPQEVIYYYVPRKITLTVHHYIEGTATKVPLKNGGQAHDVVMSGEENSSYITEPIEDSLLSDEYELSDVPYNGVGTYKKPYVDVTYTYRKVVRDVEIFTLDKNRPEPTNFIENVIVEVKKYNGGVEGAKVGEYTSDVFGKAKTRLETGTYIVSIKGLPFGYVPAESSAIFKVLKSDDVVRANVYAEKDNGDVIVHHYVEKLDGTKTNERVKLQDGTEVQDETISGKIDSIYITNPKENLARRYKLSVIPDNASGIYGMQPIEVTYYYKEQPGKVTVYHTIDPTGENVYLADGTQAEPVVMTGVIDDNYSAVPVETLDKYEVARYPANISGTFTPEDIEVFFWYKLKDTTVTVHHYIEGTQEPIPSINGGNVEDVIINGRVDDEYQTQIAEDKVGYYELVSTPVNNHGTMTLEPIEVTYYYRLKSYPYTVNYIEEGKDTVVSERKTGNNLIWGTSVNSADEIIDIEGFEYVRADKDILTIGETGNEINLYYSRLNNLSYTVNFVDKDTLETIHDPITKTNNTFEDIINPQDEAIDIPGYTYSSADKPELVIGINENTLTLKYAKRTDLSYKVNYLEKDTGDTIKDSKVVTGKTLKEVVDVIPEITSIDGFTYDSVDKNSLIIEADNNEINIYYNRRTDLSYKINYIEKGTNETIKSAKTVTGQTFESIIDTDTIAEEINGFNFDSADKDSLTITTGNNEVTFYYQRRTDLRYEIRYLDKDNNQPIKTTKVVTNATFEEVVLASDEAIRISGYDFDSADKEFINISTIEENNFINLYYAKHTGLSYTVNYYLEGTQTPVSSSKTVSGKTFGDVVRAQDEVITIYGFNYKSSNVDQITIGDDEELNVINLYYARRTGKVIAHYYEVGTTNKVAEDKEYTGFVNDSYSTQEADGIPFKYELVEVPMNKNGLYKEEVIEVFYYYKKKGVSLLVHHLEDPVENGGKYVKLAVDDEYTFEVDEHYETQPSTIVPEKYEVCDDKLPVNASGNMPLTPLEVTYYYRVKTSSVTVKYIDRFNGQELSPSETITGKVDSNYNVSAKPIDGFTYVPGDEQAEGKYKLNPQTIVFNYAKNVTITANHIDDKTGDILDVDTDITKKQGDTYSMPAKDIANYVLSSQSDNASGTVGHNDITVNFYYTHVTGGIIEKHVDAFSGDILYNRYLSGEYGDSYHTESRMFEGYQLLEDRLPTNADGFMLDGTITVTYYYSRKAKITVNYIEKYTQRELAPSETIVGLEGQLYQSTLLTFDGFELEKMPDNAFGNMPGGETTITYVYKEISGGVIVNHIDLRTGNNILQEEKISGYVGEEYEIETLPEATYDLIESTGSRTGTFTKEVKNITFYYKEKAKFVVRYIDTNTGEDIKDREGNTSTIILNKYAGDDYSSQAIDFDGYELVKEPDNPSGILEGGTTTLTYEYRKFRFNFILESKIKSMTVNGVEENVNGMLAKTEFDRTTIASQKVRVKYVIKVTNDGEIEGSAILRDIIPEGMQMDPALNPEWTVTGNSATVESDIILPGNSVEYEITLDWIPNKINVGVKSNVVEIVATNNKYGFEDVITSDNSTNTEVIIAVSTGAKAFVFIAQVLLVLFFGILLGYSRISNSKKRMW